MYFVPQLKGLELGIGTWGQKTRIMVILGRERSLTSSLAVWIQYYNVTERRTSGDSKFRPLLRIASRGKN